MGSSNDLLLLVAVLLTSAFLTVLVRRFSAAHGVLDIPNERSSHTTATPRGGGMAIVVTTTAVVLVLAAQGRVSRDLCLVLVGGGLAVAIVGFLDDRRTVPVGVRLLVHLLAAIWAVHWLGGLTAVQVGDHIAQLGWSGKLLAVLGITWVLNLFNFMDGIDGIAATEAVFMACAAALAAVIGGWAAEIAAAAWVLAFASAGFLCWNWPPARVFLGDVGSGYLGYVVAVLALASARNDPVALWVWLILGGVFFVDATTTLLRRLLRGEHVFEAHRAHAYQWLARRWRSHGKVTGTILAINLLWLLPWSLWALKFPTYATVSVIGALGPLVVLALLAGSGRRQTETPS